MPPPTRVAIEGNRIVLRLGAGFQGRRPVLRPRGGGSHDIPADTTPPGVALTGLSSQALGAGRLIGGGLAGPSVAHPSGPLPEAEFCQRLLDRCGPVQVGYDFFVT